MGLGHQFLSFNTEESSSKMNSCGSLRAVLQGVGFEDELICPQPRRMDFMPRYIPDLTKSAHQRCRPCLPDLRTEYEAGYEVLEILLSKSAYGNASSTGWCFTGSPPSRASNPLTRDVNFVQQKMQNTPIPIQPKVHKSAKPHRSSFQATPSIRVEGFDCPGSDTNCRVQALA